MTAAASAKARELFERVFESKTLAAEHPLVLGPAARGTTLEIAVEGEVRAACTLLARDFRLESGATVRGGLIGCVATDPEARGRGLGTRLLTQAERELRSRGCAFALLWASDPRFYLSRGWSPFGVELDHLLVSELAQSLPEPVGVRELCAGDEPFVHGLYERHPARVERTLEETRALLTVPGMVTLVRERAPGTPTQPAEPVAYACLGRGGDLTDVIHEWGGESEDVLALVRAHLERRFPPGETGALFLMTPPCEPDLAYRLDRLGAYTRRGILGLGKLLDPVAGTALLASTLGAAAFVERRGERTAVRGPKASVHVDDEGLQALLFGGPEVTDEARALLARVGVERARLPLEPFAFGLDSI